MDNKRTLNLTLLAIILVACAAENAGQPSTAIPTMPPATAPPTPALLATAPLATEPFATDSVVVQEDEAQVEESAPEGRLYYIGFVNQQQHLLMIDLASGEETNLFTAAKDAWLSEVAASPDGERLLLAYAPQPEQNQAQIGFTSLYVMLADGSGEPELLLPKEDPSESFFNISWPLDEYVYYAHFAPSVDDLGAVTYGSRVERVHLPAAEVEVLAEDAAWPRLSSDGSRLAYVTGGGDLVISAANGASPEVRVGSELYTAVDAPLFSVDGDQLYFSAVELEPKASLSPLDKLLGVKIAQAHSVPSDWWRVPVEGGQEPEQLTTIDKVGLYGDFDASGRHLYFVAADGVYVMGSAGEALTQLLTIPTVPTIDWAP